MREGTAIEIAESKMKELGIEEYLMRFRHFKIAAKTELTIKAGRQWYFLIEPEAAILVESKRGIFNMESAAVNEIEYSHSGNIKISNHTDFLTDVKFIQIIPRHHKNT